MESDVVKWNAMSDFFYFPEKESLSRKAQNNPEHHNLDHWGIAPGLEKIMKNAETLKPLRFEKIWEERGGSVYLKALEVHPRPK